MGGGGRGAPPPPHGDTADLADALDPDAVVLVADAGLGAINAVRLCTGAFPRHRLVVALNRFEPSDGLHALNLAWLRERADLDVVTTPTALAAHLLAL